LGDLTLNFSKWEFRCKCGCPRTVLDMDFIQKLQDARSIAGVPFHINSGYRCEAHNASIVGDPESLHLTGEAADIKTPNSAHAFVIHSSLCTVGLKRFKLYPGHIHTDTGRGKVKNVLMWGNYS